MEIARFRVSLVLHGDKDPKFAMILEERLRTGLPATADESKPQELSSDESTQTEFHGFTLHAAVRTESGKTIGSSGTRSFRSACHCCPVLRQSRLRGCESLCEKTHI